MGGVEGDVGCSGGLHRTTAHHVLADLVEVLADIATAGVEMDRQSVLRAGVPQNVPRSVRKRLETVLLRDSGDDDSPVPDRRRSLGLLGRSIWIPKRDVGQRYEALRRDADPIDQKVVVRSDDLDLERLVVEIAEVVAADTKIAEQRRYRNTVAVHDFDALGSVPRRRVNVVARRHVREVLCPPGRVVAPRRLDHRRSTETADSLIADEPGVAARLWVGTYNRDHIAPLLGRHPTTPQVGRFA